MKSTNLKRIKVVIRNYRMKKAKAKNTMLSGDLSQYIQVLNEVSADRKMVKETLVFA